MLRLHLQDRGRPRGRGAPVALAGRGSHSTLHTTHCTLHISHYIIQTEHCTLHHAHYTLQVCTDHSVYYTLHTASAHCTLITLQCRRHTAHYPAMYCRWPFSLMTPGSVAVPSYPTSGFYCTTLQHTHCTLHHCTSFDCTELHCTALFCYVPQKDSLNCTSQHCPALHCRWVMTAAHCADGAGFFDVMGG